jgi:hypothetical protein
MRSTHSLSSCGFPADTDARVNSEEYGVQAFGSFLFIGDHRLSDTMPIQQQPCLARSGPVALKSATLHRSAHFVNQAIPLGSPVSAIKEDVFVHARARLSGEDAIVTPEYFSIRRKWPRAFG